MLAKNIFVKENSVKAATVILATTLMFSNLLGLIRDHFLTQKISTSMLDTYYASFRLPDLIFNVLILGAVSSAFIPIFSGLISKGRKEEADKMASSLMTVGVSLVIFLLLVLWFLLPVLIPLLVPSFSLDKQETTLKLTRIILLSPLFFSFSYLFSAILNSYKRFMVSSLAPLVYNLSIIIATVLFAEKYGVYAVVWGVVAGAFLHMMIQFFPLPSLGVRLKVVWNLRLPSIKKFGRLMLPRSVGMGGMQLMLIGFTAIASGLGGGSVAIFQLADNIQTMPTVVFGTSIASALFPSLAESYSLNNNEKFKQNLQKAITSVVYFLLPVAVAVILLRIQIVRLVLGSGHFGWSATKLTAQTLGFFAVSLVFSGLQPLLARSFYALRNTKTPAIYAILSFAVSIALAYPFAKILGVKGLALAFSCGSVLNTLMLYRGLKRNISNFNEEEIFRNVFKILVATIAMAAGIQLGKIAIGTIYDLDRFIEVAVQFVVPSAMGAAIYFSVTRLLGFSSIQLAAWDRLMGKFNGVINGKKR